MVLKAFSISMAILIVGALVFKLQCIKYKVFASNIKMHQCIKYKDGVIAYVPIRDKAYLIRRYVLIYKSVDSTCQSGS